MIFVPAIPYFRTGHSRLSCRNNPLARRTEIVNSRALDLEIIG